MNAMKTLLVCLVMATLAQGLASCSKSGSSSKGPDDDSEQSTSEDSDTSSVTDSVTNTGLETDTQSVTDDTQTDDEDTADTAPDSETETEKAMRVLEVIPAAVSREVTSEVKVLGYGILKGAAVTLTHCDSEEVIDATSWSTVADDGESISLVVPADPDRDQGLYTITVINPPPFEDQNDELGCALSVVAGTPPTVTTVTPASAFAGTPGDGVLSDTLITIEGTGFAATPAVRWVRTDGSEFWEAHTVAFQSDTQITAVVPSESGQMPVGDYHVYVTNPNKLGARWLDSSESPGIFSIHGTPPPRISDIQPPRVTNALCTTTLLTITGSDFHSSAEVFYLMESGTCADQLSDANGNILCPMTVNSSTSGEIVARFGVCPGIGIWPIAVMNPDGQMDTFFSISVTNSSDGHLNHGAFERIAARLEQPRWRHVAEYGFDAFSRAFFYVAGGQDIAGKVLDTVEMSEINIFGRPGPFATAMQYLNEENPRVKNTLSIPRQGAAMVRVGRDLFVLGGASTRTDVVDNVKASDSVERARILNYDQMPLEKQPSFVKNAGHLPEGTWFYRVSALGPWGEGLATSEMTVYGGSGEIEVCWDAPLQSGVTGYNVYRSAAADGRSGTASLIALNVQETCFTDNGAQELAPAPARLRGAPAAGAGLEAGTHRYVVTAVVPVSGGTPMETVGSYEADIELRQTDINAGNAALTLNWDAVPGSGVTYHLYRYDAGNGQYARLSEQPFAERTFLDTGVAPLEPPVFLSQSVRPLPSGSLSLWTELDAEQFLLSPREGLEAVVVHLEPENANDPVARILAVGGRSAAGSSDASYLASAESIAIYADGSLDPTWSEEAPFLNTPRSHYALLTTQGQYSTEFPPEPDEPPCEGEHCIPISGSLRFDMAQTPALEGYVPRTLKGGSSVYVIAVMGDSDWSDTNNSGVKSFEACRLDDNGRLVGKDGFWHTQNEQSNQGTFGHGAVLYYDYLFAFWGASTETYTPGSSRQLHQSAISRYSVAKPDDVLPDNENNLLTGRQSASTSFNLPRSHYKMLRLMSYIYVIGGWADAHTDIDGNPVLAGPTGEMERHIQ